MPGTEFEAHVPDCNGALIVGSRDHRTEVIGRRGHFAVDPLLEQRADALSFARPILSRCQIRLGEFRDGGHTVEIGWKFARSSHPLFPGLVIGVNPPREVFPARRLDLQEDIKILTSFVLHTN
jgi:hypothetical protein